MLKIEKILLPLDFVEIPLHLIHQAVALARHFHAEIVLLHVVTPLSHAAGVFEDREQLVPRDLLAELIARAKRHHDEDLASELDGLTIKCLLREGDPAREIVEAVQDEHAGLVLMPTHKHGMLERVLLGSVTEKVLYNCGCPVWTGAHLENGASKPAPIRHVLCAVDFGTHSANTVHWAAQIASEFGARLTLVHVTADVEMYGPGGNYVDAKWENTLLQSASEQMKKLQEETGDKSEAIIRSGDAAKTLRQIATDTNADLLVVGCRPPEGPFHSLSFSIISESPVPVLSV